MFIFRNGPEMNQETCGRIDTSYLEPIGFMSLVRYIIYLSLRTTTFSYLSFFSLIYQKIYIVWHFRLTYVKYKLLLFV